MEKVKVNKVVAGWIEKHRTTAKGAKYENHIHLKMIIHNHANSLGKEGVDIVTLAKAIQYGYEVEYEFKIGDILYSHWSKRFILITEDGYNYEKELSISALLENIREGKKYDLVCKAENREDLK
jgi:hypothetical protein